jgi:transcriptional regulator with XRE-family HTH domain
MTTVGERLQAIMAYLGKSNKEFEISTGIDRSDVSRFKNNKKRMGIETVDRIAHSFPELSIDWLLYGRGDMLRPEPFPEGMDSFTFELVNFIKKDVVKHDAALKFLTEK